MNWFVDEQVEEEASATEIIEKLKLTGDQGQMLYMLDKELSAMPAAEGKNRSYRSPKNHDRKTEQRRVDPHSARYRWCTGLRIV